MPGPWHWSGRIFKVEHCLLPQLCSEQLRLFIGLLPIAHQCEFSSEPVTFLYLFVLELNLLWTEAQLGWCASLGAAVMAWVTNFSPKATSQHVDWDHKIQLCRRQEQHKIGPGNKGCFYKSSVIICRKLMLGQMESHSYCIWKKEKKIKANLWFSEVND